jgi:ABC-type amino acid transport substrate-binding protein
LAALGGFFAAHLAVLPAGAQESTLDAVTKRGELIAGVRFDMPPYGYVGDGGAVTGIDIDIVNAIAKKLGVKVQLKQVTAQTRIPMLTNGNIDLIAAGIGHTLEREQAVDFTVSYFENVTLLLVKANSSVNSYRDLAGKTVATIQGTPYIAGLREKQPDVKALTLQEYPQAVLAVLDGKADAFMGDDTTLYGMVKQNNGLKVVGDPHDFPRWHTALAIRQNDTRWRNFLNNVLSEMWNSGELQRAAEKQGYKYDPRFEIEDWSGWKY